jgi:hypothetical protein
MNAKPWAACLWRTAARPSQYSLLTLMGRRGGRHRLWGGFNTAVEATNKEAFCISCHEMRDNVYKEYSENTIHYTNRTGVRATCPDCHVPKEWGPEDAAQDPGLARALGQAHRQPSTPARSSRPSDCSWPSANGRA